MTVYVDAAEHPYRGMLMCHLWADTLEELYAMVDRIGVQRKWLQQPPKASWVHFDIAKTKKALAIQAGAVLPDRYGPVEHTARLKIASGNPVLVAIGERKLKMVAEVRAMK